MSLVLLQRTRESESNDILYDMLASIYSHMQWTIRKEWENSLCHYARIVGYNNILKNILEQILFLIMPHIYIQYSFNNIVTS